LNPRARYALINLRDRFSAPFGIPGFSWLWGSFLFGSVASSLESLTQGWLVLQITNSPLWVGVAAGIRGVTQLIFSIPLGAIGDRADRRRLLALTHVLGAIGMMGLWILIVTKAVHLSHVLILSGVLGVMASLERPAANGLLYDVVGAKLLLNASAFRQMGSSLVRAGGAIAGGLLIDRGGAGPNYFLAVIAHSVALSCLLILRSPATTTRAVDTFVRSVAGGLRYMLRTPQLRQLMLLSLSIESFGFSYTSMLPVMARDVLRVGASGLGVLSAASGIGQLGGTLFVALHGNEENKHRILVAAALGFGVAIVAFGLSPWFLVSVLILVAIGGLSSNYDTAIPAVLLTSSTPEMRGRVSGVYYSTVGLTHFGGFVTGFLATLMGAPLAVAAGGGIVAISALTLFCRLRSAAHVRPPSAL